MKGLTVETLCAVALLASLAPSYAMTGNEAIELLVVGGDSLRLQIYANGVIDAEAAVKINASKARKAGAEYVRPFCMPPKGSIAQAASIIEMRLKSRPETNHLDLYIIARRALLDAWPCSDEQI